VEHQRLKDGDVSQPDNDAEYGVGDQLVCCDFSAERYG
jgi:hypothetical protein